ncbi:unnamed protein product [Soboliphyme baturini]|uniref:Mitochondrial import receptor subunit TOM20-like n=1 Tax=Soboliphyme baturini TaxID=241478 RepID=A0A183J3F5_9BILA|nr:unnamed protein product [Soboliphyme baturini]
MPFGVLLSNLQVVSSMFAVPLSRYVVATLAGIVGVMFAAYCIYFDNKRRSDPDFKRKLRESTTLLLESNSKTTAEDEEKSRCCKAFGALMFLTRWCKILLLQIPNFADPNDLQAFFLQEVQLGEELLAEGDSESAVDHLANAVTLCGQPQHLLTVLHSSLPPPIFALLEERLPDAAKVSNGIIYS